MLGRAMHQISRAKSLRGWGRGGYPRPLDGDGDGDGDGGDEGWVVVPEAGGALDEFQNECQAHHLKAVKEDQERSSSSQDPLKQEIEPRLQEILERLGESTDSPSLGLSKAGEENRSSEKTETTSSSACPLSFEFDVFLNFRGGDVRYGFLYNLKEALQKEKIKTFYDKEDVTKGENVVAILEKIKVSKMSVMIFSKDYASSSFCLKELVKILECRNRWRHKALPLFYNVDPAVVAKQSGIYAEAFRKHENEKGTDSEEVRTWRASLAEAAAISGQHLQNKRPEKDDIVDIVNEVKKILEKFDLEKKSSENREVSFSLDYDCSPPPLELEPVGCKIPLMKIKAKLITEGVPLVVVSAPAGCGKTTLATAICHDQQVKDKFKGNICFFTLSEAQDLHDIVRQLFYQIAGGVPQFPDNEKKMLDKLKEKLKEENEPRLLVLDDARSGLEDFLWKLKFEIKNCHILVTSRYTFPGFGFTYELRPLNEEDAIILLCQSAGLQSNGNSSSPDQKDMKQIVKSCRGFPRFISVIGRSLRGMEAVEWRHKATQCSDGSILEEEKELRDCLQSSVDALDDEIKNCFMDLGSFHEDQRIPANTLVDMWVELHKLQEDRAMVNLFKMFRLNMVDKIVTRKDTSEEDGFYNEHFIEQHDLSRAFVVLNCSCDPIEKRKRLFLDLRGGKVPEWWKEQKQISISANLLSISTDKSFTYGWCDLRAPEVEVLVLNLQSENFVLPEYMGKMAKLKVLIVTNNGLFPAELDNFVLVTSLSNLKRIRLEKVSIPTSLFNSMQMKTLEKISLVMCNTVQALAEHFMKVSDALPNLREVNIDYCNDLVELPPGFCDLVLLSKLSIINCHNLVALPKEIGNLVKLKVLRLNSCIELSELPDTIGNLHDLNVLDISNCLSIKTLPQQIGDLRSLRKLCMVDCSYCELPNSVIRLEMLEEVIGDEGTLNSWQEYKSVLPKLELKVHKDISLSWLH